MGVCIARVSLCHYPARGDLSIASGPHLLPLQGRAKHGECQHGEQREREGREDVKCKSGWSRGMSRCWGSLPICGSLLMLMSMLSSVSGRTDSPHIDGDIFINENNSLLIIMLSLYVRVDLRLQKLYLYLKHIQPPSWVTELIRNMIPQYPLSLKKKSCCKLDHYGIVSIWF